MPGVQFVQVFCCSGDDLNGAFWFGFSRWVCAKVKKLRKAFAREEKRRKELPLELKQKVSREILQRLRDLGENRNTTEQRGLFFFFCLCLIWYY